METGKFYEMVATPLFRNDINNTIGGLLSFWDQFEPSRFGQMIGPPIRGAISKVMNDLRAEMMKQAPFQDIFSL